MAKNRTAPPESDVRPAEGFIPAAVFGDEGPVRDDDESVGAEIDQGRAELEAEVARLKAENANKDAELIALRGVAPSLAGGKFTVSIKDGPTATIEARPGETPQDAFLRACGIHSTPHRPEVHEAKADAVCGIHMPSGTVKPFFR